MKLTQALGITGNPVIAFTGAGGKTSAMVRLAREFAPPVLMTTTTHLGGWQASLADQHLIVASTTDLRHLEDAYQGLTLITGPLSKDDRLVSLDPEILDELYRLCLERGYPLLIEADGARQLALKAPAPYEPVIPAWVEHVVVLAGLFALGRPLDATSVHRPERFAKMAQLAIGGMIAKDHVARVLASPRGSLKGIPVTAARYLFLNQAEGEIRQASGAWLAKTLEAEYARVLIGSLQDQDQEGPIYSAHSRTAGIILAAGGSERLGQPKQLLTWFGQPFIRQVAQAALTAGLSPVIVVTGAHQIEVENALEGLPVCCVCNPHWASGQSTSLNVGINALPEHCERVMFMLSDQPQLSPLLIRQLIERHNIKQAPVTVPIMRGSRGNPVLFAKETFASLRAISGDQGGRAVFSAFKVDELAWCDDRYLLDVDQASDLDLLRGRFNVSDQSDQD